MNNLSETQPSPINLVVLISGGGTNLQSIIDSIESGDLDARIAAVISDKSDAYGLQRAKNAGIPTQIASPRQFADKPGYQRALAKTVANYSPDLVVLAGFMRILDEAFIRRFSGRIINIHPSLLPRHKGLDTHQRALDAGDLEHGASVHFVTENLDDGPIILQARVAVRPEDTSKSLRQRVLAREHEIYPRAIQWFAEGKISIENPTPGDCDDSSNNS